MFSRRLSRSFVTIPGMQFMSLASSTLRLYFFSRRRRHTRSKRDWSSDVCSSDLSFFINKEGNRYVKEDGGRDEICLATFEQTDGQYYMINDSKVIPEDRLTLSGEKLDKDRKSVV